MSPTGVDAMSPERPRPKRSWPKKFRDAFRGMKCGVAGQSSFRVHFPASAAVIAAAAVLQVSHIEWCLLLLCITVVLTAEMFNSGLEFMGRAITREDDPQLGTALDIGSAAVLTASLGAVAVGTIVFAHRLVLLLGRA